MSRKRVYIATDDIPVINIIQKLAPEFITINLPRKYLSIGLGNYFQNAFPKEIIESTLIDLHLLSRSDYLVCDVSSNLCRLVYELKQTMFPFVQENILKPVGEEQEVYYRWWNFVYPFSLHLKFKTSLPNGYSYKNGTFVKTLNKNKSTKKKKHTKEKLQKHANKSKWHEKENKRLSKIEIETQKRTPEIRNWNECSQQERLLEWPGTPCYHFFTCQQERKEYFV